jgi:hypothetical protein
MILRPRCRSTADDSGDDNVDSSSAPPPQVGSGSRHRSRAEQMGCAILGVKGSQFKSCRPGQRQVRWRWKLET